MDKSTLSDKVVGFTWSAMMVGWALLLAVIIYPHTDGNLIKTGIYIAIAFLLTFPIWLFLFLRIAVPVGNIITALICRFRA